MNSPNGGRRSIYTQADWDEAVAAGELTAEDVFTRLEGIVRFEFGQDRETWPIAYDEDGFVTALIAEGIPCDFGVTLVINTRDHPPPHVHIERKGQHGRLRVNLETGEIMDDLPRDVRMPQMRKFLELIAANREQLVVLWNSYTGDDIA